jgi:hypothetical protein
VFYIVHQLDRRGRDRIIVGYTTACLISVCHHESCEFESRSWGDFIDTTLCDLQRVGGIPFSTINKINRHGITEILLQRGVKYHNPNHSA